MKYLYHHRTQGLNVEGVHIHSICNALAAQGHEVKLVSVKTIDENYLANSHTEVENANIQPSLLKTIAKNIPEPLFELLEFTYSFYSFFRLWYVISKYRPDRIYERYSLFLFSTVILAKLYSIPIVYEINDSAQLKRLRPLFFKRFASYIEKRIFSYASGLVFVSKRLENIIHIAYPSISSLSIVSHNAADKTVFFSSKESKTRSKEMLNLTHKRVCGFIGCFAPWHGVDRFMSSIAPRLKQHPDLTLLLIGDGKTLNDIQRIKQEYQLDDQVIITGNIPHIKIIDYIHAMDFSVLPSSNEYGSPMKMFELMAAGVPLLAAGYAPIAEVIEDDKDGWLFPPDDFDTCIEKLFTIYNQPELIKNAALFAEDKVHTLYQWSNNAHHLEQLYLAYTNNVHQQSTLG